MLSDRLSKFLAYEKAILFVSLAFSLVILTILLVVLLADLTGIVQPMINWTVWEALKLCAGGFVLMISIGTAVNVVATLISLAFDDTPNGKDGSSR